MILQTIISQSRSEVPIGDISAIVDTIEAGVDTDTSSIYWFRPYRSSDFPMITCDKTYFFLWSTDHASGDTGAIWWGKGNNLDLSDFEEVGVVTDSPTEDGPETPFIHIFPEYERPLFFYYHTLDGLCTGQNTRLKTAVGGAFDSMTWTQETDPLGCQGTVEGVTQNHTGYMRFWRLDGTIVANHHFNGAVPLTFQRSNTVDGLSFTHQDIYTQYHPFLPDGRSYQLSWSEFFTINGNIFGLVNSCDDLTSFSGGTAPSGKLHLVRANSNLEIIELIKTLNDDQEDQAFDIFIEGTTAHLYRQTGRTDRPLTFNPILGYATFDLTPLYSL